MKQTAVEWVFNKLLLMNPNLLGFGDYLEQAKEIEKQQIINGRITAPITTGDIELDRQEAEHYYTQEYGGEK